MLRSAVDELEEAMGANASTGSGTLSMAKVAQEVFLRTMKASSLRMFNVPENGNDRRAVEALLVPTGVWLDELRVSRVGRPSSAADAKHRALLVTLSSASDANHVMKGRANIKLDNVVI